MSLFPLDFQDHYIVDLVIPGVCSVKSLVDSVKPIQLMAGQEDPGSLGFLFKVGSCRQVPQSRPSPDTVQDVPIS